MHNLLVLLLFALAAFSFFKRSKCAEILRGMIFSKTKNQDFSWSSFHDSRGWGWAFWAVVLDGMDGMGADFDDELNKLRIWTAINYLLFLVIMGVLTYGE